jgi:hypothetical protein
MIKIVTGVDLYEDINKYDVILVGTNIYGYMSHGFQRKVMLNYPYVQEKNMSTRYGDESKLGTIVECKKENQPIFVLLYINKGGFRRNSEKDYLQYESLDKCMRIANILYKGKKVACTFIGASQFDGNGNKEKVFEILTKNSSEIDLSVYDYEQLSRHDELKNIRISEIKLKEIDAEAYYEAVKKRKEEAEERFKNNGHARY